MKRAMIRCDELIGFLDDYVEDRLSPDERACFEAHLSLCEACVRYLNGYRDTLRALALVARESDVVPDEVPEELVEAILAARRSLPTAP